MQNSLIPVVNQVPTKTEIASTVKSYFDDKTKTTIEKYLTLKVLENLCKEALKIFTRIDVVESALTMSEGDMKFNFKGADIQLTKEPIRKTVTKYIFSDVLGDMRKINEIEISKLKIKMDALKKEIKDNEIHEINSDIATKDTDLIGGEEVIEYGIKITLPK